VSDLFQDARGLTWGASFVRGDVDQPTRIRAIAETRFHDDVFNLSLLSPARPFLFMAPKRRPQNVVRSGNAGNSTKPSAVKPKEELPADGPPRPPPLFPPGYKPPLSMLNEKCQKAGWEKPLVDTVSVSVTL